VAAIGLAVGASLIALAAAAQAAQVSTNWAGYVVQRRAPTARFTRVIGAWTEPSATCSVGRPTYAAFWVGLGGHRSRASALEQTGTEADCNRSGRASYSAWYELVPNPPVSVKLQVRPGDAIAASVTASAGSVILHLRDLTNGGVFSRRVGNQEPDTSSAEWIAEAPSACDRGGCQTLPLTNFGSVTFSGASAVAANGHRGTLSDPAWKAVEIEIQGDLAALSASRGPTFAGATPCAASSSGASFAVTWRRSTGPAPPTPPTIGPTSGLPA
jgi:hypothetical protein